MSDVLAFFAACLAKPELLTAACALIVVPPLAWVVVRALAPTIHAMDGDRGWQASDVSRVRVQWIGGVQNHPEGQDPGRGRDTDDPRRLARTVTVTRDDARGGGALDVPGGNAGRLI